MRCGNGRHSCWRISWEPEIRISTTRRRSPAGSRSWPTARDRCSSGASTRRRVRPGTSGDATWRTRTPIRWCSIGGHRSPSPSTAPAPRNRSGWPAGGRSWSTVGVVVAVADDLFGGPGDDASSTRLRGGDALLAELERARTGEMLDIVATIQAEQDEIIRAPLPELLTVQGGPGTGKTAVGLHRAAFLLYNHPQLSRDGVLVLGPSRAFLRYIAQVLPSLGEEAVVQTTVPDLAPKAKVRTEEPMTVRRLKGDPRMAELLARALAATAADARRAMCRCASASLGRSSARSASTRWSSRSPLGPVRTRPAGPPSAPAWSARLGRRFAPRPDSGRTRSGSRRS